MKAIHIDAQNRTITEIEQSGLEDLQSAVGGLITVAMDIGDRDTLYVDDEGLYKEYAGWFEYEGGHQPFAGNGIICGIDYETGEGTDTTLTVEQVREKVRFMSYAEVQVIYG